MTGGGLAKTLTSAESRNTQHETDQPTEQADQQVEHIQEPITEGSEDVITGSAANMDPCVFQEAILHLHSDPISHPPHSPAESHEDHEILINTG